MKGGTTDTVSYPYMRNMMGMKVDDESMKNVPHAQSELYVHVATKCAQLGAILGGLIGGGKALIRRGNGRVAPAQGFANGSRTGMLIGIPLGVALTYLRMKDLKKQTPDFDMDYAYYDRSYRLRNNRNQVRVDRCAYAGLGIGTVAAAATGSAILNGTALGLVSGTLAGAVCNIVNNKKS